MHAHIQRVASFVAALGFVLCTAGGARATGFQFAPVRVTLTANNRADTISIVNSNDLPLRLEVKALQWTQDAAGASKLTPTNALLAFPELLTVPPHSQRNIRVARTEPPGPVEVAYKVAVTEIGSFSSKQTHGAGLSLDMQANIPIYILPTVVHKGAAIADASVQNRTLTFSLLNTGSTHFLSKDVRIAALGAGMRVLSSHDLDGGDVLAGAKHIYRVALPRAQCAALRALTIRLTAGEQQLNETVDVPAGACKP